NYINNISSSINKELTETKEDIINNLSTQKSLVDTLEFYKKDDKVSILDIIMKVDGIKIPTIKINSWEAISNSKIELMKYDDISTLANIQEQKEVLTVKSQNMMNFVYPNIKETG